MHAETRSRRNHGFGQAEAARGAAGQLMGAFQRTLQHPLGRAHFIDQPDSVGFVGSDQPPRKQQIAGVFFAHQPHHKDRDQRRHKADFGLGEAHFGSRAHEGQVAHRRQPCPACHRVTIYCRYGGLGKQVQRLQQAAKHLRVGAVLLCAAARHGPQLLHVQPRAKGLACARQHHGPHVLVSSGFF